MNIIKHKYSSILSFSEEFYEGMNYVVKLFFEMLIDFRDKESSYDEMTLSTNIYHENDNHLNNFISYGLLLSASTMHPFLIETLLLNARDSILNKTHESKKDLLGLQLLYVIKSVNLIRLFSMEEYFHYSEHIVTYDFDTTPMRNYIFQIYKDEEK